MTPTNMTVRHPLKEAGGALIERLRQVLDDPAALEGRRILRIETQVETTDPLLWLKNQTGMPQVFWRDRSAGFAMAGLGSAHQILWTDPVDFVKLTPITATYLNADQPLLRFYGGFGFDHQHPAPAWPGFGNGRLLIPRFELITVMNETLLVYNCPVSGSEGETGHLLEQLASDVNGLNVTLGKTINKTLPRPSSEQFVPSEDQWRHIFEKILTSIGKAELKKVVLARKTTLGLKHKCSAADVLDHLLRETENSIPFLFQFSDEHAFLGVSPERLYLRQGRKIQTEAIAGTRSRSADAQADQMQQESLLRSRKDREEHAFVVDAIKERLTPLCEALMCDPGPSVLNFQHNHHLITRFAGRLKDDVDDGIILDALHPTPAVAGTPTSAALEEIRRWEKFNRGWYAAPVGYIGPDSSEFSVALRCGHLRQNELDVFSGAGIVAQSDAASEWHEIDHKIHCFRQIFS